MALAINSLPVPVSPSTRTVESVGATRSTSASTDSSSGLSPMISSNLSLAQPCSLDATLLTFAITDSTEAPCRPRTGASCTPNTCCVHLYDSVITLFSCRLCRAARLNEWFEVTARRQKACSGMQQHQLALPADEILCRHKR